MPDVMLTEKETMSKYSWNANDYKTNSQVQQVWAKELIEKLSLNGTEDILDLGCGDGKVTAEISNAVKSGTVIGIDNSSSMIAFAKEHFTSEKHSNLSFQEMNAQNLNFEECFDIVFSNAVLHWVKDHNSVLEGIYKSLKKKGRILLQMGGKGGVSQLISVLDEILSYSVWQAYFQDFEFPYTFLGVEEYETMLLDRGFQIKRVELIHKDAVHEGKEKFKGWIRTTWIPYLERIPEEKREEFIETLVSKYIEQVPLDAKDNIHVDMVMLEVEAEKA